MCTGGMLCHHECLKQYLEKGNQNSVKEKCEVCKFSYQLKLERRCGCSHDHVRQKIKARPFKCALYTTFFVLTLGAYGYLLELLIKQELTKDITTIVMAVLACLSIMFIFFLIIWTCEYTILNQTGVV
jgi:hypothetical protein